MVAPPVRRQRGQLRRRVVSKDVSRQLRRSPSTVICTLSLITGFGYGMVAARESNGGRLTVPSNARACRTASQSPVLPVTLFEPNQLNLRLEGRRVRQSADMVTTNMRCCSSFLSSMWDAVIDVAAMMRPSLSSGSDSSGIRTHAAL
jgi:hypothetical protein